MSKDTNFVYKAVRLWDGNKGYSALVEKGIFRRCYRLNHKTKANPRTLGIFVFVDQAGALDFIGRETSAPGWAVLQCNFTGQLRMIDEAIDLDCLYRCKVIADLAKFGKDEGNILALFYDHVYVVRSITPLAVVATEPKLIEEKA